MTNIVINPAAATPPTACSGAETKAVFGRLRALAAVCGTNKHDIAMALITACILEGWDTGPQIIGTLSKLDLNPGHVAIILKEATGTNPELHLWRRDVEGRYSLLDEALLN